jgi:hypothetical protein
MDSIIRFCTIFKNPKTKAVLFKGWQIILNGPIYQFLGFYLHLLKNAFVEMVANYCLNILLKAPLSHPC